MKMRWLLSTTLTLTFVGGCADASGVVRARFASDFGCAESDVHVEAVPGSAYRAVGCGQSAEYTCEGLHRSEWLCVTDNPSSGARVEHTETTRAPDAEPSQATRAPLRDPPPGAGGFDFDIADSDARSTCEKAGHAYGEAGSGHATCDGLAADIGAPAVADLTFCGGNLCGVTLKLEVAHNANIARALARWKAALVERYGEITTSRSKVPGECDDDLRSCLLDGSASVHLEWTWPTKQRIVLTPESDRASKVWISIAYTSRSVEKAKAPGL